MRRKIVKKLVENPLYNDARRFVMVVLSACIMAININSFIHAGNLLPGGFSGITLLIQQIGLEFWKIKIPYTLVNLLLNAVPVVISFKYIGKKFTGYSCLMLVLSSILTDILPGFQVTDDILLVCVFGGIIHAFALSLCLNADSTSGGTDFIAIFFSEKYGIDTFNYIFVGNVIILLIAGSLFGWREALYSIIFQFTSTQVLHALHRRYQKQTLLIVTKKPDEVYEVIKQMTNHDATLIKGEGCYMKQECDILYSVVGRDEVRKVLNRVRETDPAAFVNMIRTESLSGRFYQRPND